MIADAAAATTAQRERVIYQKREGGRNTRTRACLSHIIHRRSCHLLPLYLGEVEVSKHETPRLISMLHIHTWHGSLGSAKRKTSARSYLKRPLIQPLSDDDVSVWWSPLLSVFISRTDFFRVFPLPLTSDGHVPRGLP